MESINNGRAKIQNSINGTQISIPSKKNWFVLLFGTAWLGGWYFGLTMALGTFSFGETGFVGVDGFMLFWIIGWSIGGAFVIGLLLWGYFGQEQFLIGSNQVELSKKVFGIGTNKVLKKSAVKNIRFNEVQIDYFSGKNRFAIWGIGEGKIKFDYGMKTYSFGLGLDDAEANYLIELLGKKVGGN